MCHETLNLVQGDKKDFLSSLLEDEHSGLRFYRQSRQSGTALYCIFAE